MSLTVTVALNRHCLPRSQTACKSSGPCQCFFDQPFFVFFLLETPGEAELLMIAFSIKECMRISTESSACSPDDLNGQEAELNNEEAWLQGQVAVKQT